MKDIDLALMGEIKTLVKLEREPARNRLMAGIGPLTVTKWESFFREVDSIRLGGYQVGVTVDVEPPRLNQIYLDIKKAMADMTDIMIRHFLSETQDAKGLRNKASLGSGELVLCVMQGADFHVIPSCWDDHRPGLRSFGIIWNGQVFSKSEYELLMVQGERK